MANEPTLYHYTFRPWRVEGETRVVAPEYQWPTANPISCEDDQRRRVLVDVDPFEDWRGPMVDTSGKPLFHLYQPSGTWSSEPGDHSDKVLLTMQDVRNRLFSLIDQTPNLDWIITTKFPENIAGMMPRMGFPEAGVPGTLGRYITLPNIWLGTSVENQQAADERIPHLLNVTAAVRFVLYEGAGPLDLSRWLDPIECNNCGSDFEIKEVEETVTYPDGRQEKGVERYCRECHADDPEMMSTLVGENSPIHLVICRGESGPNARPMHPDWVRSLRDQCQAAGVPFWFEGWGGLGTVLRGWIAVQSRRNTWRENGMGLPERTMVNRSCETR